MEITTLAGGCFWCTQAIFKRLNGVEKVTSGYAGGDKDNPNYEQVSSGNTGHAEAIQIEFDPKIISFEKILEIFWATHDPTTLNRQGSDIGNQYRSDIFYHSEKQKEIVEQSKKKHEGKFSDKIITEISPYTNFYTAEEYHQNYYDTYKSANSYCSLVISPKIQKLITLFNGDVKDEYK